MYLGATPVRHLLGSAHRAGCNGLRRLVQAVILAAISTVCFYLALEVLVHALPQPATLRR